MAKFRSKPVEIEAVQLTKDLFFGWVHLLEDGPPKGVEYDWNAYTVTCNSRQGPVRADLDDWIIQESDGSGCYPCKPDVFAAKYEAVDGEPRSA